MTVRTAKISRIEPVTARRVSSVTVVGTVRRREVHVGRSARVLAAVDVRYRRLGCMACSAAAHVSRVAHVDSMSGTGVTRRVGILVTDGAVRVAVAPSRGYRGTGLSRITKVVTAVIAGTRITTYTDTRREAHRVVLVSIVGTVINVTVRTTDADTEGTGQ